MQTERKMHPNGNRKEMKIDLGLKDRASGQAGWRERERERESTTWCLLMRLHSNREQKVKERSGGRTKEEKTKWKSRCQDRRWRCLIAIVAEA